MRPMTLTERPGFSALMISGDIFQFHYNFGSDASRLSECPNVGSTVDENDKDSLVLSPKDAKILYKAASKMKNT